MGDPIQMKLVGDIIRLTFDDGTMKPLRPPREVHDILSIQRVKVVTGDMEAMNRAANALHPGWTPFVVEEDMEIHDLMGLDEGLRMADAHGLTAHAHGDMAEDDHAAPGSDGLHTEMVPGGQTQQNAGRGGRVRERRGNRERPVDSGPPLPDLDQRKRIIRAAIVELETAIARRELKPPTSREGKRPKSHRLWAIKEVFLPHRVSDLDMSWRYTSDSGAAVGK